MDKLCFLCFLLYFTTKLQINSQFVQASPQDAWNESPTADRKSHQLTKKSKSRGQDFAESSFKLKSVRLWKVHLMGTRVSGEQQTIINNNSLKAAADLVHSRSSSKCVSMPSAPGTEQMSLAFRKVLHLFTRQQWPPSSFCTGGAERERLTTKNKVKVEPQTVEKVKVAASS